MTVKAALIACSLAALGLAGCGDKATDPGAKTSSGSTTTSRSGVASGGKMVFHYFPTGDAALEPQKRALDNAVIRGVVDKVNASFLLPRNILVRAEGCGRIDARYMPERHAIQMCLELPQYFQQFLTGEHFSEQDTARITTNATVFSFLHELGHAMVAELDIGVSGGEENAADDFATLFLIELKAGEIIRDGAISMLSLAKLADPNKPKYWDEHAFGEQRFYNVTCTYLGSDFKTLAPSLAGKYVPEERAARCQSEFARKQKWFVDAFAKFRR